MDYEVIIVGAGASGLMAAIAAAREGSSVLVIDQNDKAGKKILATGNGKCNFTNLIQKPECYRSDDSEFAVKVLSRFDVPKTIRFFEELGIYPKERNGYLYPNSEQAASVVQVLMMECDRLKVHFAFEEAVVSIEKPYFTVVTENRSKSKENGPSKENKNSDRNDRMKIGLQNKYHGAKLILAAGGCASPQLGSDGSGLTLAKRFGHSVIKPLPALVQLKSPEKFNKTLSGVRTIAKVTAYADVDIIAIEEGEILFADYGISGIPVLQISRYIAKALDQKKKVHLKIDFLPDKTKEEVKAILQSRIGQNPNKSFEEMMIGLFNHKLSYIMIKEAKLDPYKIGEMVTEQEVISLTNQIKRFKMDISDTNSFENAQVSAGGVNTKEIHDHSMESKLVKNLYLAGELVDVDGTCGGYNLQWAWSSGYLAGSKAGSRS